MGQHCLLNLYGCDRDLLDNEFFLVDLLERAANECGATVLQTIYHSFDPQGVTAICLLSESHISVHTWPEKGLAAIDVFTCGYCEPKVACDVICGELNPQGFTLEHIDR